MAEITSYAYGKLREYLKDNFKAVAVFDGATEVKRYTNVTLTIYDESEKVVKSIDSAKIKQDGNKYFYDYTHDKEENYIFEFKGMYENLPVLCRQFVEVVFV